LDYSIIIINYYYLLLRIIIYIFIKLRGPRDCHTQERKAAAESFTTPCVQD